MEVYFLVIEKKRKDKKLSQKELCNAIGVTRVTYWKWINGITSPRENKVRQISKFLGIPIDKITDLPPEPETTDYDIEMEKGAWLSLDDSEDERIIKEQKLFHLLLEKHQKQIKNSSILIKAILSSMDVGIYVKDHMNRYILANKKFKDYFNLTPDLNVTGKDDYFFFGKTYAKVNYEKDQMIMDSGIPEKYEGYIPNSHKKKWGLIYKYPVLNKESKIVGLVSTFIDITERKKNENLSSLLVKALENTNQIFFLRNSSWDKYYYVSPAAEKFYGYQEKDFLSVKDFWRKRCLNEKSFSNYKDLRDYGHIPYQTTNFYVNTKDYGVRLIKSEVFKSSEYVLILEKDITDDEKGKVTELEVEHIARKMLKKEINVDIIKYCTGISLDRIAELRVKYKI